jgi:hypothetical protein
MEIYDVFAAIRSLICRWKQPFMNDGRHPAPSRGPLVARPMPYPDELAMQVKVYNID